MTCKYESGAIMRREALPCESFVRIPLAGYGRRHMERATRSGSGNGNGNMIGNVNRESVHSFRFRLRSCIRLQSGLMHINGKEKTLRLKPYWLTRPSASAAGPGSKNLLPDRGKNTFVMMTISSRGSWWCLIARPSISSESPLEYT
jgi:hypothetical protein